MKRTLLIKQVTGRLLLDTSKADCPFTLEKDDEGWTIKVEGVDSERLETISSLRDDLNLFYFEQSDNEGSLRKWWFYDKQTPDCKIDRQAGTIQLHLDSKVAYSNEHV